MQLAWVQPRSSAVCHSAFGPLGSRGSDDTSYPGQPNRASASVRPRSQIMHYMQSIRCQEGPLVIGHQRTVSHRFPVYSDMGHAVSGGEPAMQRYCIPQRPVRETSPDSANSDSSGHRSRLDHGICARGCCASQAHVRSVLPSKRQPIPRFYEPKKNSNQKQSPNRISA